MDLPKLPQAFDAFLPYLNQATSRRAVADALEPFQNYETKLRQIFAQHPSHPAVLDNHLVSVFAGQTPPLTIRARDLTAESQSDKDTYLLPLADSKRRENGSLATVSNLKEFKTNFNLFSESSLVDLDWSNVVAAGSSVVTALLPVDAPHNESKRALRAYYHEQLAPASDVDLFIYGLDEAQALEKIKQIEGRVRDSILSETTTVRTKNAITIVSEYPTRHIQIVLRLYKSVSEILTGFDVDCACVAYDGQQVWASPRALGAFATQTNNVDLTRRSPSYENRLSKYAQRGFEVFWPLLNRSNIDPTIYERAFNRVQGLARLLVLEKLPHPHDRDEYLTKRREERGRPSLLWNARYRHQLPGNVKDAQPNDIAEWVEEADVSSYHTFTIPYGPRFTSKKIEKLVYTKDLLLNAEWNKPKDRKVNLHRHPAFFGTIEEVSGDCCGFCPKPETDEDLAVWEEENKTFITGKLEFIKDDPGRQAVGSFNPITDQDWTDMAYIGNTVRLCQAIVDNDLEEVLDWLNTEEADVNKRDHTGRTPLQLAVLCSSPEIVQCLIERGARLVSRLYNGMTALHLAAHHGNAQIVKLLLEKSQQNMEEEERKEEERKKKRRIAANMSGHTIQDTQMTDADPQSDDEDLMEEDSDDETFDKTTEGSFVKVGGSDEQQGLLTEENVDDPDVYDVDVLSWDNPVSPLHLAIMAGHDEVVSTLIDGFGADVMLPVKIKSDAYGRTDAAILSLVLPLKLPLKKANDMVRLLLTKGASPSQGDMNSTTALYTVVQSAKTMIFDTLQQMKPLAVSKAIDHVIINGYQFTPVVNCALLAAISTNSPEMVQKLIDVGASPTIKFETFARAFHQKFDSAPKDPDEVKKKYQTRVTQPVIQAALQESMVEVVNTFIDMGVDVNTLSAQAYEYLQTNHNYFNGDDNKSLLDIVRNQLKRLQKFLDDKSTSTDHSIEVTKPPDLPNDDSRLKDLPVYSYSFWKISKDLEQIKEVRADMMKTYEKNLALKQQDTEKAERAKQNAVQELVFKYTQLEQKLISKGAKTFNELYPDQKSESKSNNYQNYQRYHHHSKEPWNIEFKFQVPDLTDTKREAYIELFEAAFAGDVESVKTLCITGRADQSPLQIAVTDDSGFNPFSIAVLRGHENLARTILEIAASQYEPKTSASRKHYSLQATTDEDYDSEDSDGSDAKIVAKDVLDDYTVDDISAHSNIVKCQVKPVSLLNGHSQLWRFMDTDLYTARAIFRPTPHISGASGDDLKVPWSWFRWQLSGDNSSHSHSLFRYAIVKNDISMIRLLLELQQKYTIDEEGEELDAVAFPEHDFRLALKCGHVEIIGEIIKQRGILLPLSALSRTSDVKLGEAPKYYQGLNVHGQKRKDWAKQAQKTTRYRDRPPLDQGSPLLSAILDGTRDVIDYFMSDAPVRHYEEFAVKFKDDVRIQRLMQASGGFGKALRKWMATRSNLALHMAVMAWPGDSLPRLRHLIQSLPAEYLEAKDVEGQTPLHLAFRLENIPLAEALIAAGANVATRNANGENILHTIYRHSHQRGPEVLKKLVSILGPSNLEAMIRQRSQTGPGSVTPLASVLPELGLRTQKDLSTLDAMLSISEGQDLEMIDGAGDFPLHTQVRNGNLLAVRFIASKKPDLLYWENATGMTPIEVAESQYFQDRIQKGSDAGNSVHLAYYRHNINAEQSIVTKPAKDFIKNDKDVDENIDEAEVDPFAGLQDDEDNENIPTSHAMYRLVLKLARRNPGKRRLVSLLDANEVAKRLAYQQQTKNEAARQREAKGFMRLHRRHQWYYDEQNAQRKAPRDEVTEWIGTALTRKNRNPWHEWIEAEGIEQALERFHQFAEGNGIQCKEHCEQDGHRSLANEIDPYARKAPMHNSDALQAHTHGSQLFARRILSDERI